MSLLARRDTLIGAMYLTIGGGALWAARGLPRGTGAEMGPGYFPVVIAGALVVFGLLSLGLAIARDAEHVQRPGWRGLAVIAAAIIVFAFALERLGLPIAMMLMLATSTLALPGARPTVFGVAAIVGFTAFCCLIFVVLLGLPMPLLGDWLG